MNYKNLLSHEIGNGEDETIIIERTPTYMILSAIVNGERVAMRYIGYTQQEALELFKEYLKEL
jgi:hypothetical protein